MKLKRKDLWFVGLQLLLFTIYVFNFRYFSFQTPQFIMTIGLLLSLGGGLITLLAMVQLNTNLSPFPTPKKGAELINTGLYRYIRHPIYTGILMCGFGFALYTGSGDRIVISMFILVLFYFKSCYEEERLADLFPTYQTYQTKTGRFIPKLGN